MEEIKFQLRRKNGKLEVVILGEVMELYQASRILTGTTGEDFDGVFTPLYSAIAFKYGNKRKVFEFGEEKVFDLDSPIEIIANIVALRILEVRQWVDKIKGEEAVEVSINGKNINICQINKGG